MIYRLIGCLTVGMQGGLLWSLYEAIGLHIIKVLLLLAITLVSILVLVCRIEDINYEIEEKKKTPRLLAKAWCVSAPRERPKRGLKNETTKCSDRLRLCT